MSKLIDEIENESRALMMVMMVIMVMMVVMKKVPSDSLLAAIIIKI